MYKIELLNFPSSLKDIYPAMQVRNHKSSLTLPSPTLHIQSFLLPKHESVHFSHLHNHFLTFLAWIYSITPIHFHLFQSILHLIARLNLCKYKVDHIITWLKYLKGSLLLLMIKLQGPAWVVTFLVLQPHSTPLSEPFAFSSLKQPNPSGH